MTDRDDSGEAESSWTLLGSGTLTEVWTDGEQVKRPLRPWSEAIHQLLLHLEHHEVGCVPRFVGTKAGDELLTHLPGRAIRRPWPEAVQSPTWMEQLGRWLCSLHTATSSFRLTGDASFAWGSAEPPPSHVVTHGDLGPWNMLEREGDFAGVIDWDLARFGEPLDDLAEAAFELGPLRDNRDMLPGDATDRVVEARVEALCRGYGGISTDEVIGHVEPLYQRRIDAMTRLASEQAAPFVALARAGNIDAVREDLDHFREHF